MHRLSLFLLHLISKSFARVFVGQRGLRRKRRGRGGWQLCSLAANREGHDRAFVEGESTASSHAKRESLLPVALVSASATELSPDTSAIIHPSPVSSTPHRQRCAEVWASVSVCPRLSQLCFCAPLSPSLVRAHAHHLPTSPWSSSHDKEDGEQRHQQSAVRRAPCVSTVLRGSSAPVTFLLRGGLWAGAAWLTGKVQHLVAWLSQSFALPFFSILVCWFALEFLAECCSHFHQFHFNFSFPALLNFLHKYFMLQISCAPKNLRKLVFKFFNF